MERGHENGREQKGYLEGLGRKKEKGEILQLNYNLKNKNQNFVAILWKIKINLTTAKLNLQCKYSGKILGFIHFILFIYTHMDSHGDQKALDPGAGVVMSSVWVLRAEHGSSGEQEALQNAALLLLPCYLSRKKQVEPYRTKLAGVRWEMTNLETNLKNELHMGLSQNKVLFLNA